MNISDAVKKLRTIGDAISLKKKEGADVYAEPSELYYLAKLVEDAFNTECACCDKLKRIEADRDNWRKQCLTENANAEAAHLTRKVPMVRVVDPNGKVCCEGYYFAYPEWQAYPVIENGEKPQKIPLVEIVCTYDQGDWGLPNHPRFFRVTPPHRIEIIDQGKVWE